MTTGTPCKTPAISGMVATRVDLTEEDAEVGMAYPDYLKKYQAMFPYVATTETFGLLWRRDCLEWLVKNIGRHSVDFYNSSDCIVFKRQEDCVLFSMTWL